MCAAQLLLEFVSDGHPRILSCWADHAADLDKLAAAALAATGRPVNYTYICGGPRYMCMQKNKTCHGVEPVCTVAIPCA